MDQMMTLLELPHIDKSQKLLKITCIVLNLVGNWLLIKLSLDLTYEVLISSNNSS
jgi:hypothetical protein